MIFDVLTKSCILYVAYCRLYTVMHVLIYIFIKPSTWMILVDYRFIFLSQRSTVARKQLKRIIYRWHLASDTNRRACLVVCCCHRWAYMRWCFFVVVGSVVCTYAMENKLNFVGQHMRNFLIKIKSDVGNCSIRTVVSFMAEKQPA